MLPAALVLTVLGTALNNRTNRKANQRRLKEVRKGREKESKISQKQRDDVMSVAEQFDPAVRQEALDTKAADTEERIKAVLADNDTTTTGDIGVISDALLGQRAKSTRDRANKASVMAALLSKVQAPGYASQDEGLDLLDLVSRSKGRTSGLNRVRNTTDILANLEGATNPKSELLSGIMQGAGTSLASSSIMSGLNAPGTPAAPATGSYSPNPGYGIDWNKINWMEGV